MAEQNGQSQQQWNRLYFDEWVAREGLDLIRGTHVENVYTVPLKPWARTEGHAVQIQLDGTGEQNAAYVCEIPPGKQLTPQRHLYEELVYVLSGRGSTSVWYPGKRKNSFEWQAGSLFLLPLNAYYQHFNGSGTEPARYLAMTTAPIMMNLLRNDDFIFNNDAVFPERYAGEDDFFSGETTMEIFPLWDKPAKFATSHFYADINAVEWRESGRGVGIRGIHMEFGNSSVTAHTLEFPGGTFSKLHRHGPGAHVLWLRGEGYSLMFPDGGEWVQEHWGPGTMIVPPSWWWHQHAIASREPAQHLALKPSGHRFSINRLSDGAVRSTKAGGSQLDYEDMPREWMERVKALFAEECGKRGTPVRMDVVYEG
jgi:uncharacterized RmlC-like cupin family protein